MMLTRPTLINKKAMALMTSLALASTFLGSFSALAQQGMPPAQVEVATASIRLMAPVMEVSGTVISVNDSRIAAQVEGPLQWIAEIGTHANAGDTIARIDDRIHRINVLRAEANVERLKADAVFRQQDVERFQRLASTDSASRARLEEVTSRLAMARQDIADAEAFLDRVRGDLERTAIKAPFSGHVVQRLGAVGEYMTVGKEIIRLVDTDNKEVVIPVPITVTPFLHEGDTVPVYDENNSELLPIRTVVPVGDMVSRMVEVRLSLPDDTWIAGAPVKVSIPKGVAANRVAIPRDAIVLRGSSLYVYKVGADNVAQQVPAEIEAITGLWISLKSGINDGDKIIVRGAERLMPGQSVSIKE